MKQTSPDPFQGWVLIVQNSDSCIFQILDGPKGYERPRPRVLRWLLRTAASAIGSTLYKEFFR